MALMTGLRLGLGILLGTLLASAPVAATPTGEATVPAFVRLSPMVVSATPPQIHLRGLAPRTRRVTIRFILETAHGADAATVCRHETRVRNAIQKTLKATPIPLRRDGRLNLSDTQNRLLGPINRCLGGRLVTGVFMVRSLGTGAKEEAGEPTCEILEMGKAGPIGE